MNTSYISLLTFTAQKRGGETAGSVARANNSSKVAYSGGCETAGSVASSSTSSGGGSFSAIA